MTTLALIAAVARNGVIGDNNALPWRLPQDQQFFRRQTMGCPLLMGRKTWESLPPQFRPLPGRLNIVLTRQPHWRAEGATVVADLDAALLAAGAAPRLYVIGGAELYAQALARADELVLTEIDADFDGDAHFPDWPRDAFVEVQRASHRAGCGHEFDFSFVTYRRRGSLTQGQQ